MRWAPLLLIPFLGCATIDRPWSGVKYTGWKATRPEHLWDPKPSEVTYCFTTPRTGVRVYRAPDTDCPDTTEVDWYVTRFASEWLMSRRYFEGLPVTFSRRTIECGHHNCKGENAKKDHCGAIGCQRPGEVYVWLHERAHDWDGWGRTLWHELCHEFLDREGWPRLDNTTHKGPCFNPPSPIK